MSALDLVFNAEIHVNGRTKTVTNGVITFEELLALAFGPASSEAVFVATYDKGIDGAHGILEPGQIIGIKEHMVFNIMETNQA
jgi:hypothetical protein